MNQLEANKIDPKRLMAAIGALVSFCVFLGACSIFKNIYRKKPERGIIFNHALHADEGLDCTDCHDFGSDSVNALPNHDICSICHTIPELDAADTSCAMCHARPDYTISPRIARLSEENKFEHAVHLNAEVSCSACHLDPQRKPLPTGSLKPLCMDCHASTEFPLALSTSSSPTADQFRNNECSVCHKELSVDTIPHFRAGTRLAHDSSHIWEQIHGRESQVDPQFCAQCHDEEDHCAACHRITEPTSHTASWNRKLHGLRATWDRQKCSVCHEEESCSKCHLSAHPTSHRGSFRAPQSTHCVQCHFPPENNCAICHEAIDHFSTPPTPHTAGGGSPGACNLCHPGGVPGAVPHLINMTAACTSCHQ